MERKYYRELKVEVPFEHCSNCPAFELETTDFYHGGFKYFGYESCKNAEICTLAFEAARGAKVNE